MSPLSLCAKIVLVLALAALAWLAPSPARAESTRRFAILVAQNSGGPSAEPLRFAENDAAKLERVLIELGGFRDADIVRLSGARADDLLLAFDEIERRMNDAREGGAKHLTVLMYYSGHARHGELWLDDSRLPMRALRDRLTGVSADVRIGIIDSCESGAITRQKGGRRGPSFLFDAGDREDARGVILISSSSADETSQESDLLRGSFFTHYLTSGLRGDADRSGDQRVTLAEVYAYAYHKTVSATSDLQHLQHPTYRFDLEGQDDVILTDLTRGTSGVVLGADIEGEYMIFDEARVSVPAEIAKKSGRERRIALPPGRYFIKKRLRDHLLVGRVSLSAGAYVPIDETGMDRVAFEDDPTLPKGLMVKDRIDRERTSIGIRGHVVYQSFLDAGTRRTLFPPLLMVGVGMDVSPLFGADLKLDALLGSASDQRLVVEGIEVAYNFFEATLGLALVWKAPLGPVSAYGGPRLAAVYVQRSFPGDDVLSEHRQDNLSFSPGVSAGLAYVPERAPDLQIEVGGNLGYLPWSVDRNRSLLFGELGLSVRYRP